VIVPVTNWAGAGGVGLAELPPDEEPPQATISVRAESVANWIRRFMGPPSP